MKTTRRVSFRKIITNINLSEAENILKNHYKYQPGKPGRPPISPTGMFLSFLLMFLRMESYRDYHEFLEKDHFWRRQLGSKGNPDIGDYSHFIDRIDITTFETLFNKIVQQLITSEFLSISTIVQVALSSRLTWMTQRQHGAGTISKKNMCTGINSM